MTSIKTKLKRGNPVFGTFVSEIRNPNLAYILAECGLDYFILDNEHGSYNPESVVNMVAAARGAGIAVVVRVPEIRREPILKALDAGAAGILVPMVDTAEDARQVVQFAKYPPEGRRGAALCRPHNRYRPVAAAEYLQQANAETFIAVQAETARAVANLPDIVAVEGIDAVFVGPLDLSIDLGIPGQTDHPKETAAIEKVIAVCTAAGVAPGLLCFEPDALKDWVARGIRFAVYSADVTLMMSSLVAALAQIKS